MRFAFLAVLVFAAGCASSPERLRSFETGSVTGSARAASAPVDTRGLIARSSDHQKVGRPYTISGQRFVPRREDSYDEIGIGSWYGPNFHGRPTANGEIFDQNQMTAAHTTLPIPSIVEVTNLENGRQVIVRLNDRGPFVDDRIIDLSRAAAEALDYRSRGLARVRVRYLGPAHPNAEPPAHSFHVAQVGTRRTAEPEPEPVVQEPAVPAHSQTVTLQVGAFADQQNAQALASRISSAGDAWVQRGQANGNAVYRVFFGRWPDRNAAHAARDNLTGYGVYDARIVALN
ncbi:septal ring lytic transglycosylase RlpA family protein [Maricaulis sp.]|uniref:septal ring lytic transglycosylase RlpA family protein n=1 Tax=Maricaulis sp. TaxID=1486257 RepID=UPI00260EA713|nr:septal ring lytic transglycosylase RlpA family protein [Maricaulis sp.]